MIVALLFVATTFDDAFVPLLQDDLFPGLYLQAHYDLEMAKAVASDDRIHRAEKWVARSSCARSIDAARSVVGHISNLRVDALLTAGDYQRPDR
jgi:hypothetical protein